MRNSYGGRGTAYIAILLVTLAVTCALLAPLIAPQDPDHVDLRARLMPPAWSQGGSPEHVLGTDAVGRDLLSRIVYGARVSLLVGVVATGISIGLGVLLGILAGFFGGRADALIMRVADVQLGFPFILLAITVMAVFGSGLWKIVLLLGFAEWVSYARVVRSEVLSLKEQEFVQAARAIGASETRIIARYLLPNIVPTVVVLSTLNVATNILLEAGLTFLGLGVDPTIPAWGSMLADGRNYVTTAWWVSTFPGLAIMTTVLGFNMFGDWWRDRLDPRLRGG